MRKVLNDGTLIGTDMGDGGGSMHVPSFDPKFVCLCAIPDCPCRDINEWKLRNPTMTRYRLRKLREFIQSVERKYICLNS